jgi:hypothetical protein
MSTRRVQFIVDESGNKTAVVLAIEHYSELLEAEDEVASIRAYDEAKAADDEVTPFTKGVNEIEGG